MYFETSLIDKQGRRIKHQGSLVVAGSVKLVRSNAFFKEAPIFKVMISTTQLTVY